MVQTLEDIKGGGGSIKVGTTGTIGSLMTRELESKASSQKQESSSNDSSPPVSGSIPTGDTTPRRMKSQASADEASSSGTSEMKNRRAPENGKKPKLHTKKTHQIPMLKADNVSVDGTPVRKKPAKKGPSMVEVVDIKCRNPDKTWVNPITNRLKKLGFSKLSESIV